MEWNSEGIVCKIKLVGCRAAQNLCLIYRLRGPRSQQQKLSVWRGSLLEFSPFRLSFQTPPPRRARLLSNIRRVVTRNPGMSINFVKSLTTKRHEIRAKLVVLVLDFLQRWQVQYHSITSHYGWKLTTSSTYRVRSLQKHVAWIRSRNLFIPALEFCLEGDRINLYRLILWKFFKFLGKLCLEPKDVSISVKKVLGQGNSDRIVIPVFSFFLGRYCV